MILIAKAGAVQQTSPNLNGITNLCYQYSRVRRLCDVFGVALISTRLRRVCARKWHPDNLICTDLYDRYRIHYLHTKGMVLLQCLRTCRYHSSQVSPPTNCLQRFVILFPAILYRAFRPRLSWLRYSGDWHLTTLPLYR